MYKTYLIYPSVCFYAIRLLHDTGSLPLTVQVTAMNLEICRLWRGRPAGSQDLPIPSHAQLLTACRASSVSPNVFWNGTLQACERSQQVKAPAHKLDDLSSICESHTVIERTNSLKCTDLHTHAVGLCYIHTQMQKTSKFSKDNILYKLKILKTLTIFLSVTRELIIIL